MVYFFTILDLAIDELNLEEDERSTDKFNNIKYIIIDDPVSSLDDSKLVTMAMSLIKIINSLENRKLCFLITTHHALFFNIIYNTYPRPKGNYIPKHFIFKRDDNIIYLNEQKKDSPFGYHLVVREEIEFAINNNGIRKYHFNLFRSILEKTANFLGYHNWRDCIPGPNRNEFIRLINLFSHDKLSDLEYRDISDENKKLFTESFENFIDEFKWKVHQQ